MGQLFNKSSDAGFDQTWTFGARWRQLTGTVKALQAVRVGLVGVTGKERGWEEEWKPKGLSETDLRVDARKNTF